MESAVSEKYLMWSFLQCYTEIVISDQKDSLMASFMIFIILTRGRCGGDQCILKRPRQYVEERPQCYPL